MKSAGRLAVLPALGLALLPKCPLCLVAYGALGTASFLSPLYRVGLLPVLGTALAVAVGALFLHGRRRRRFGPALLALAAAAAVLAGKFFVEASWLVATGLAMLLAAVFWSSRMPVPAEAPCGSCSASTFPPPCLGHEKEHA